MEELAYGVGDSPEYGELLIEKAEDRFRTYNQEFEELLQSTMDRLKPDLVERLSILALPIAEGRILGGEIVRSG